MLTQFVDILYASCIIYFINNMLYLFVAWKSICREMEVNRSNAAEGKSKFMSYF